MLYPIDKTRTFGEVFTKSEIKEKSRRKNICF